MEERFCHFETEYISLYEIHNDIYLKVFREFIKIGTRENNHKKTRVCIEEEFPSPLLSELLLILINFLQQTILLFWDILKVKGLTYYGKCYFKQS